MKHVAPVWQALGIATSWLVVCFLAGFVIAIRTPGEFGWMIVLWAGMAAGIAGAVVHVLAMRWPWFRRAAWPARVLVLVAGTWLLAEVGIAVFLHAPSVGRPGSVDPLLVWMAGPLAGFAALGACAAGWIGRRPR